MLIGSPSPAETREVNSSCYKRGRGRAAPRLAKGVSGRGSAVRRFGGSAGMASRGRSPYHRGMETSAEIRERWRYLRDLLITQLDRFESGAMQMHSGGEDVSAGAIVMIKRHIKEFDELIARSEKRDA